MNSTDIQHSLTLEFGRVLSEAEWREVVEAARKLPHVQGLRANADLTTLREGTEPTADLDVMSRLLRLRQAFRDDHLQHLEQDLDDGLALIDKLQRQADGLCDLCGEPLGDAWCGRCVQSEVDKALTTLREEIRRLIAELKREAQIATGDYARGYQTAFVRCAGRLDSVLLEEERRRTLKPSVDSRASQ